MNDQSASVPSVHPAVAYRPAAPADVDAIFELIREASCTTTVLPRPRQTIEANLHLFVVAERAGRIIGCGALTLFTPHLAEVRSLVVGAAARGLGIGGGVVKALIDHADRIGVRRLFALTDNPGFFQRQGFALTDKSTLPHKVWNECVHCPKFLTCTEEAVDLHLSPDAVEDPSLRTLEVHPNNGSHTNGLSGAPVRKDEAQ